jgi:hypothetical protein
MSETRQTLVPKIALVDYSYCVYLSKRQWPITIKKCTVLLVLLTVGKAMYELDINKPKGARQFKCNDTVKKDAKLVRALNIVGDFYI